jgi:pimeloyl-ACP methyl ester carboxylesterase
MTVDTRFNDAGWPGRDKASRIFVDAEDAVAQFSLAHGDTDAPIPEVVRRHIALSSLRQVDDGWRWKRTDRLWIDNSSLREMLPHLVVPLAIVRTERGVLEASRADEMRALTPTSSMEVVIPVSGHNPQLDNPVAFVAVLRAVVSAWLPAVEQINTSPSKEID